MVACLLVHKNADRRGALRKSTSNLAFSTVKIVEIVDGTGLREIFVENCDIGPDWAVTLHGTLKTMEMLF